jgi:hypothetical protein
MQIKQHITPKQALQITEAQFYSLAPDGFVKRNDWANYHHKKITIGKMIEFLCNNGWNVEIHKVGSEFRVANNVKDGHGFTHKELCDALWEAIKHSMK